MNGIANCGSCYSGNDACKGIQRFKGRAGVRSEWFRLGTFCAYPLHRVDQSIPLLLGQGAYLCSMRILRKTLHPVTLLLGMILIISCNGEQGKAVKQEDLNPSLDSCSMEPDHQYALSLPDHLNPGQKLPLVIVIDPHGDGLFAMHLFRSALGDIPVVIAGSKKLRNNYAGFETSLKNLYHDLLQKYPVDPQMVVVAGFSGGARMAFYYGMKNPVHGIIMFGAGPGAIANKPPLKQIYAVSGTRDFNFVEQYRPLFSDIRNDSYVNDYFRGTHSWPPERYILEAVVFCLRDGPLSFQELSRELSDQFQKESDSLQRSHDLFLAGKALEKSWYFGAGNGHQKNLTGKIDAFKHRSDWIACQEKIETFLRSEYSKKQRFMENLSDPDTIWWSNELKSLMSKINGSSDPDEKDYYFRLKGFLGIYLYTQINAALQNSYPVDLIDRLISIYGQVEPGSKDLPLFIARAKELHR